MCARLCSKEFGNYIKLFLAVLTLLVVMLDLASDLYALPDYFTYRVSPTDHTLTWALLAVCSISSLIFIFEIRNIVVAVGMARRGNSDRVGEGRRVRWEVPVTPRGVGGPALQREERSVSLEAMHPAVPLPTGMRSHAQRHALTQERWTESVALLQTLLEDFPFVLILYFTHQLGSCQLVIHVFEDSLVGQVGLVGSVVSSSWKVLHAFIYCCCCGYRGMLGCDNKVTCLLIRTVRAMVACLILTFTLYLFYTLYLRRTVTGADIQPRCTSNSTDTSAGQLIRRL